jgi:hypothetical protein
VLSDVGIALLAAAGGFVTALWLLLLWVGDGSSPPEAPSGSDVVPDWRTCDGDDAPFIPLPDHLKTRAEIVAWMTTDLPRLLLETPDSRTP